MIERIKDYNKLKDECIEWIRKWFYENGNGCNAIIGLSGGKDSTIVAKLCTEALGADKVIGVSLPGEGQNNEDAIEVAETLGIELRTIHLGDLLKETMGVAWFEPTPNAELNLPARFRMMMLYYVAQSLNGRVVGTCNASENYIGYFTKFGDGASDLEPLGKLTVHEVKQLGYVLGIPRELVDKTPDDGLPNSKPDEEKFGFSYDMLDEYICDCNSDNVPTDIKLKIQDMHVKALFKINLISQIDTFFPEDVFDYEFGPMPSYDDFMESLKYGGENSEDFWDKVDENTEF